MNPFTLMGGLFSAIPEIYKLTQGIKQRKEGTKGLEGLTRPEYVMPEEAKRALGISQMRYADKFMPGEGAYTDRIEQQAANAYGQSSEAGNPFALISNLHAQSGNQLQDMQTKAAQFQLQNENAYKQQLMSTADYRDQEWQMNEFAPYKEKYTEYRDMIGAGTQNIYGGMDSLAAIGTGLLGSFGQGFGMGGKKSAGPNQQAISGLVSGYNGNPQQGQLGPQEIVPGQGLNSTNFFGSW